MIVHDTHEPLVTHELFDLVQRKLSVKKRQSNGIWKFNNVFTGITKCFDCGASMTLAKLKSDTFYLCCHKYRSFGKEKCTTHYIRYDSLYKMVLMGIRENGVIAKANEHRIDDYVRELLQGRSVKSQKSDNTQLTKLNRRKDELDRIIKRLFEENVLGNMPPEEFYEMSSGYKAERTDVISRIDKIKSTMEAESERESNYREFIEIIKQYTDVETLNENMLFTLIEQIDIHAPEGYRSTRTQQVDIHYRLIDEGLVRESPDILEGSLNRQQYPVEQQATR